MPSSNLWLRFGQNPRVPAKPGQSLLKQAIALGLPIGRSCRGEGLCSACTVQVRDPHGLLNPVDPRERQQSLGAGERLACLARVPADAFLRSSSDSAGREVVVDCPAWPPSQGDAGDEVD